MTNNECVFCSRKDIEEGLLYQNDNFFVRAAVRGAMAPGHVLLIPKRHLSCFGVMPEDFDAGYGDVLEKTRDKITKYFSLPILTEQGVHGQSVKHAHLHFVPSVSPWYDFRDTRLVEYVPNEVRVEPALSIGDIRKVFREDGQYVTIEQNNSLSICRTLGCSGTFRFLRDIATKITGRKDLYDWRTVIPEVAAENKVWVKQTIDKLREI